MNYITIPRGVEFQLEKPGTVFSVTASNFNAEYSLTDNQQPSSSIAPA